MTLVPTSSPQEVIRNISSSLPPYPHCFVQDAQTSLVEQIPRRRVPVIKKTHSPKTCGPRKQNTHLSSGWNFCRNRKMCVASFFLGFFLQDYIVLRSFVLVFTMTFFWAFLGANNFFPECWGFLMKHPLRKYLEISQCYVVWSYSCENESFHQFCDEGAAGASDWTLPQSSREKTSHHLNLPCDFWRFWGSEQLLI